MEVQNSFDEGIKRPQLGRNEVIRNLTNNILIFNIYNMPYIENYLKGIIRVETTTKEEHKQWAAEERERLVRAIERHPFFGMMAAMPDALERERIRKVFIFGRLVSEAHTMDSITPHDNSKTP